jgi:FkbM family methyltransferase
MWVETNAFLKQRLPRLHFLLKKAWTVSLSTWSGFPPVPKRVGGTLFWAHPRLLTSDTSVTQPLVVHWISQRLQPGEVFFDVGAHYGWMSLRGADRVGPAGHVVAFEPSPVLVGILNYHKRVNRVAQMTIDARAVSDHDSKSATFFLLNEGLSSRNSLTIGNDNAPFVSQPEKTVLMVSTVTLDSYCRETDLIPSLVKVDVEGAELMVLEGAQQLMANYHPDLIVAVHPYWLPPGQNPG